MIHPVAQTNLQLWEQLVAAGWGELELRLARVAYELAARIFGERLRPSGKHFVAHVVGVASLVQKLGEGPPAVAAALLHSAYTHGDFGRVPRAGPAACGLVRAVVGEEVERLIARYAERPWNGKALRALHARLAAGPALAEEERTLARMRLANELEDYLDRGELYLRSGAAKRELFGEDERLLVEAARALAVPELAEALAAAIADTRHTRRSVALRHAAMARLPRGEPRVLVWRHPAGRGGVTRLVAHLAQLLPSEGIDVHPLLGGARAEQAVDWLRTQGVVAEARDVRAGRLRGARALWRAARALRADVVNSHNERSLGDALAARLAGARFVASPHVVRRLSRRERWAWRALVWLSDAVVVGNQEAWAHFRSAGVPERKLRLVPSGVLVPDETPARAEARARLGIESAARVVACATRLSADKGVDVLIDAVALVPDPERTLRLVVAGEGRRQRSLERRAEEKLAGRARFLGFLDDPTDLYAAADVFALASRREGAPLVVREAAMHGLPSVATDVGATRSVVSDGVTGLLVPAEDPPALAAALAKLLGDAELRARMGEAARAWARCESEPRRMARGYAEVLRAAARPR